MMVCWHNSGHHIDLETLHINNKGGAVKENAFFHVNVSQSMQKSLFYLFNT